jgi:hypothetical protein
VKKKETDMSVVISGKDGTKGPVIIYGKGLKRKWWGS